MAKEDGIYLVNGESYVPTATSQARTIKDSSGTSITSWFQSNKTTVYIVLGGAVLGLIIYFYVKNQQTSASSTAGTTDTSTTGVSTLSGSPTDGASTSGPGSTDFSPIDNLLQELQTQSNMTNQELAQLNASQSTTKKKKSNESKKHEKKESKSHEAKENAGGGFMPLSSEHHQDMHVVRNPFRNTGHRIVYSVG